MRHWIVLHLQTVTMVRLLIPLGRMATYKRADLVTEHIRKCKEVLKTMGQNKTVHVIGV